MTNQHGDFIWYELLTSDAGAAGDFYGKVIGWTSTASGQPGMDYRFFSCWRLYGDHARNGRAWRSPCMGWLYCGR
jgi:predicted enzyme related to lactoylglutathione lyase